MTHTHTHTFGWTPLDDGLARCILLYLTTHNIHKRQVHMPCMGIEPTIPANEQQLTHVLDRAATEIRAFELNKLYTVVDGDICK